MELAALLAVVIGALMPPAVAQVTRVHWPSHAKLAVALGTSAVLGTITAWATGALQSAEGWATVLGVVFTASQIAYRTWWHREPPSDVAGDTP